MTQTITAMFDTRAHAQAAVEKLVAAGVARTSIRLLPESETGYSRTGGSYDYRKDEGGFWASLKDIFMPEEDRYAYSEGMSRGDVLVSVEAEPARAAGVADLLEESGAVNVDEREAEWRKEGWSGYASSGTTAGAATAGATMGTVAGTDRTAYAAQGAGTSAGTSARTSTGMDVAAAGTRGQNYIPIVEERLNVGKRVQEQGRVRVRSYVVEKPVSEQVRLRDESVHVERRPVDRPVTAADERLFAEKTIEAVERDEVPVVSKDARVVEEVGIRKDAVERTETVQDKVRRTEVEVEDERGNVSRTGTTGTTAGSAGTGAPRKPV